MARLTGFTETVANLRKHLDLVDGSFCVHFSRKVVLLIRSDWGRDGRSHSFCTVGCVPYLRAQPLVIRQLIRPIEPILQVESNGTIIIHQLQSPLLILFGLVANIAVKPLFQSGIEFVDFL